MKKEIIRIIGFFIIGVVGGMVVLHLLSFSYIEKYLKSGAGADLAPIQVVERREITVRENEALVESVSKVRRAIIGVRTGTRSGFLEGSGVIVSSDGLVVTLAELVPVGGNFNFLVNGDQLSYEIIRRDLSSNLALVRVDERNLPTLEFGNEERISIGERVFLLGTVFEGGNPFRSANEGIVKRIDTHIRTNVFEERALAGSSLFDIEGRLLGINLVSRSGEVSAIPISIIREFISL